MTGFLILENGEIFEGERIGYNQDVVMELVVNNENFGYIETLTDPSYYGQGIVFSYPLVGNYGIIPEYCESDNIWASAIFVQEIAEFESNIPNKINFDKYLRDYKVPGLSGIDVGKLENIIKKEGSLKAYLTSTINNMDEILEEIKNYKIENPVMNITTKSIKKYGKGKFKKLAVLDLGLKHGIVNSLLKRNTEVIIYPANTSADVILYDQPNGIVITNGPGNPESMDNIIKTVKVLCNKNIPILGIGLGHELIGIANGFKTEKLKNGNHGINFAVKDVKKNKIYMTSQNFEYAISKDSINYSIADIIFQNIDTGIVVGLYYKNCNAITVQFEPEGCPGPLDMNFIFDDFIGKI